MQAGIPLTYYNCNHEEGILVDGVVDNDVPTEDRACYWEFVTGEAGTYVRTMDLIHDLQHHPEFDPDVWFNHWFYDSASPSDPTGGDDNSPVYATEPRAWHMCGTVTSGQTEAWGTHGFKFDFEETLLILNTDPLRDGHEHHRDDLPPEACQIELRQPQTFTFEFYLRQYYEAPNMPVEWGQQYFDASANPLYRN
jgi:hypothetical protein